MRGPWRRSYRILSALVVVSLLAGFVPPSSGPGGAFGVGSARAQDELPTDTPTPTETSAPLPVDERTATATSTPTQTATRTASPTSSPTETSTATPTDTITVGPEETGTAVGTSTPTATASATATMTPLATATGAITPTVTGTPTCTPTPTAAPLALLEVSKLAQPAQVAPGETITYTVILTNTGSQALTEVVVKDLLPEGVDYAAERADWRYDSSQRELTWRISTLPSSEVISSTLTARVGETVLGGLVNSVEATAKELLEAVKASVTTNVVEPGAAEIMVSPDEETVLLSLDGRVEVRFPAGAVARRLRASIAPQRLERTQELIYVFRLEMRDLGAELVEVKFVEPVSVIFHYTKEDLEAVDTPYLGFYWLDEESSVWWPVHRVVHEEAQTLITHLDHFSIYGVGPSFTRYVPVSMQDWPPYLSVVKTAIPEIVRLNDLITYTLTITNPTEEDLPGISVEDTLPTGFSYAGEWGTDPPGIEGIGFSDNGTTLSWTGLPLDDHQTVELYYNAAVGESSDPLSCNDAEVDPTYQSWTKSSAQHCLRLELPWWNDAYRYRRPLDIHAHHTVEVTPTGTVEIPIGLVLNTESLIQEGKLLPDGSDLRVVYWSQPGWLELPREVQGLDSTASTVWFPLQDTIEAGVNGNYYIYYGNPRAEAPSDTIGDVFGSSSVLVAHLNGETTGSEGEVGTIGGSGFSWVEEESGYTPALITDTATLTYSHSGNIDPAQGTIALHVKPPWQPGDETTHYLLQAGSAGSDRLELYKDDDEDDPQVRFKVVAGGQSYEVSENADLVAGGWSSIVATWHGGGDAYLYQNGEGTQSATVTNSVSDTLDIWLGSQAGGGLSADAVMANLMIYSEELSQSQALSLHRALIWTDIRPQEEELGGTPPSLNWWDDDFFYRRQLTITPTIPVSYTSNASVETPVRLTLDTQELVQAGKLRTDAADLRVVYRDGDLFHELPREVRWANTVTTTVWFPLHGPLAEADSSYYLYYGNAVGSDPSDSIDGVFGSGQTLVAHVDGRTEGSQWEVGAITGDGFAWVGGEESGQIAASITDTATLSYDSTNIYTDTGTIAVHIQPQWPSNDGHEHYLLQAGSGLNGLALLKGADDDLHFRVGDGTEVVTATGSVSWSAGEWLDLVAIWDQQDVAWYLDDQPAVNAGTAPVTPTEELAVWLGSEAGGSEDTSGQAAFMDLMIYDQPMTEEQVLSRYRASQVGTELGLEETPVITVTVQPDEEAVLVSADGSLIVSAAAGTFTETVSLVHTPHQATVPQGSGSLARFDLTAETQGGTPIHEPANPIELTLDYSAMGVDADLEETIAVLMWDEIGQEWEYITTTVNITENLAMASVDHLSDHVFGVTGDTGSPPSVPTVASYETDLFTGAATLSYPIEVAPGTNGMQPDLTLTYNSILAEQKWDQQAGALGLGFDLGAGFVEYLPLEQTYRLVLNGVSEELVYDGSQYYHTQYETFWRIERRDWDVACNNGVEDQPYYWMVTTKDGTQYRFGCTENSTQRWLEYYGHPIRQLLRYPSRYYLDKVTDTNGNYMTYSYTKESTDWTTWLLWQTYTDVRDDAVYLQEISYTGNDGTGLVPQRKVTFSYVDRTISDTHDYPDQPDGGPLPKAYLTKLLDSVTVALTLTARTVRTYEFEYDYKSSDEGNGPHNNLVLEDLTLHGTTGVTLPSTTFQYHPVDAPQLAQGLLFRVDNGYGAKMEYEYRPYNATPCVKGLAVATRRIREGTRILEYEYEYTQTACVGRGNGTVYVTDPTGAMTRYRFHGLTEGALKGRLDAVWRAPTREAVDSDPDSKTKYVYTDADEVWPGVYFVALHEEQYRVKSSSPITVTRAYDYDEYGNLREIDELGDVANDGDDRRTEILYTYATSDTYIVDRVAREETFSANNDKVAETRYYYDGHVHITTPPILGNLTWTTQKSLTDGQSDLHTHYGYDAYGNVQEVSVGDHPPTMMEYAPPYYTFPMTTTYPITTTELSTMSLYDVGFGTLAHFTGFNGWGTSYFDDPFGRLDYVSGPQGVIDYEYVDSAAGLIVTTHQQDPDSSDGWYTTSEHYNGLGQLTGTESDGENGTTIRVGYVYDDVGRLEKVSAPYIIGSGQVVWTQYEHDILGRTITITNTDQSVRNLQYDGWHEVIHVDEEKRKTEYQLDAFGRTVVVDEFLGEEDPYTHYARTGYEYDALDNLVLITDAENNQVEMQYDGLGRKVYMCDPDLGCAGGNSARTYFYDENGNLDREEMLGEILIDYEYDVLNRLTMKDYPGDTGSLLGAGVPATYKYDTYEEGNGSTYGRGLRTSMSDGSGETRYEYDNVGRLETETKDLHYSYWQNFEELGAGPFITSYTYDLMGRVKTMTYPDGEIVTYSYDDQTLLGGMVGADTYVDDLQYNALSQPVTLTLGNDLHTVYDYYPDTFRLESIVTSNGAGDVQELHYDYDKVGNLESFQSVVGESISLSYVCDGLNRLTDVADVAGGYERHYRYDAIGRLTDKEGLTLTYGLSGPHQVASTDDGRSYAYSDRGNRETLEIGGTSTISITYEYDAEDRLTQVLSSTNGITESVQFLYDGDGNRVLKIEQGAITLYAGDYYEVRLPWSEAQPVSRPDERTNKQLYPAIAIDAASAVHAAWAHDIGEEGYYPIVEHNRMLRGGDLWETRPVTVTNYGDYVSLAADSLSNVYAVYRAGSSIGYATLEAGSDTWELRGSIRAQSVWPVYQPVAAVDSDDNLHVAWIDTCQGNAASADVYYAWLDADTGTWSENQRVTDGNTVFIHLGLESFLVGNKLDMAIDGQDNVYLVWVDNRDDPDGYVYSDKRDAATQAWGTDVRVNDDYDSQEQFPNVVADQEGNAYAVWSNALPQEPAKVYAAKRAAGAGNWGPTTQVNDLQQSGLNRYVEATIDRGGNVYATWVTRDDPVPLRYSVLPAGGSSWSPSAAIPADVADQWDIAVDLDGIFHVVYDSGIAYPHGGHEIRHMRLLREYSTTKYYYANGQRVAMRYTEPSNGVDDLYFIHGDQSGSTVLITDDTGQEVGRAHYEPFGETFSSTIPMTLTERLFSGQVLDSSTGLYYYGNGRYYDPSIGRYISPDPYLDAPFSSQRLDRYNFGFNNPLRYKRSEALPDFTFDSAKGVLVADAVSPASLCSSFSDSLTAESMSWLRRGVAALKLVHSVAPNIEKVVFMAKGGFRVVPRGTYASELPRFIVYGSHWSKAGLYLPTHLTHAGAAYDDLARWAAPSAAGEFTRAVGTKSFWILTIGSAVVVNVIDYGWGSKADVGIGSTEFYAAMTVDVGFAVASAGTGALLVGLLLLASPATPAAGTILVVYFFGQGGFTVASWHFGWREGALRRVTRVYEGARTRMLSGSYQGSIGTSPLLR